MSVPDRPWWLLPPVRVSSLWWVATASALLGLQYVTVTFVEFPVVYVIPVSLAAWYSGRWPALALAVTLPVVHFVLVALDDRPDNLAALVPMTIVRGCVIGIMALWFARLSEHERALGYEVQTLRGMLLPICQFCKSIKNDQGQWEPLERFISRRSATRFSHGLCPSCQETHYGQWSAAERAAASRDAKSSGS